MFILMAVTERERTKGDLLSTVYFPNDHDVQDWARLKPGTFNSIQVSQVDG